MKSTEAQPDSHSPLESMEEWDDFLKERYPEVGISPAGTFQATDSNKKKEQFRNYEANARPSVREFYRQNHLHQTYEFAQAKRKEYLGLNHRKTGVYEEDCGLDKVRISWGHDEYIFNVAKDYMPEQALYMLRYHSFYQWHREGEYNRLANDYDREMMQWVLKFNNHDLYTKNHAKPDVKALRPFYEDLFAEFFPAKLNW